MLSVEDALSELLAVLDHAPSAVLVAPPGAGKTTRVPPALLNAGWRGDDRIIVVEPRRIAAKAAARRIAEERGEEAGQTVGFRVRNETAVSGRTRIELVTAGVFVRMILDDPALEGIAAVLFDEVHERGVDMDLGLALAIDAQAGLRDDLRLLAMSATMDGARFAALLGGAPVVESRGRLFPIETHYLGSDPLLRIEDRVARAVRKGLAEETGSVLAFLPGQGEILRTVERLEGKLPANVTLAPLYGAMDARAQDAVIRPASAGRRKVVLATAIAETSLTIEGVRLVVDSGLARRPRYDPGSGLSRLETVRVSQAAADQRRGRAGRTEPGVCYRLWDEPQTAALPAFDRPEILETDLSALAISLLAWGVEDPGDLRWLDPPPSAAFAEALDTLDRLGARAPSGGLSAHGRRLADLPLAPRLAHLVLAGAAEGQGRAAADIAAIVSDPGLGGRDTDLRHRLDNLRRDRSPRGRDARQAASRWAALAGARRDEAADEADTASLLAMAFPERVAQRRGGLGRFRLANGRGARLEESDALANAPFLAVGDVQGGGADGRITLAAPLERAAIDRLFGGRIVREERLAYDASADLVRATRVERLDALVLSETPSDKADPAHVAEKLAEVALSRGIATLPWGEAIGRSRGRIAFLRARQGEAWPDLSDEALAARPADWLVPALTGKRRLSELGPNDLRNALAGLMPWDRMAELDRLAPESFTAPSGRVGAIDYSGGEPTVAMAVQNLFSLAVHPAVLAGAVPIVFELLSPAGRPMQVTRDLPAFWRGSWRDVRADMRGRYPKHSWPEDPANAPALAGAKRR
ncbi:ATP-dependent helicase HrpB [Faunimonas pinastri]|uniref:ATP-dependent helicase HrpB n=1 Tax=Faunimonas pinastri TaxID=1855383 RepID=A0A1H9HKA4_9HYPH|nr:ATP-dependent helicase HrpB [Faunimonas pinastri]SEQ62779.1 ATP-dependent helicase HrpB [Faunimonas pinastri]